MTTNKAIQASSILTQQKGGFLSTGPYVFTHTLSPYTGCGFGNGSCGAYCYAPSLPSWQFGPGSEGKAWGSHIVAKENAAELLGLKLAKMTADERQQLRIFMSSSTDPYQPLEAHYRITEQCLGVFQKYDDLGLLVVQTRSPLAERDLETMARIPYLWLSVSVETDNQSFLNSIKPGSPSIESRLKLVLEAKLRGINTQITVSPCLPYTSEFAKLLGSDILPDRVVVDSLVAGDGARGTRTAKSPLAARAAEMKWDWRDQRHALALYHELIEMMGERAVGWSSVGFCGIKSRLPQASQLKMF